MTKEEAVAYVHAQSVAADAHLMGMAVANAEAVNQGKPRPYGPVNFFNVQKDYCISHNAVLQLFQETYHG